MMGVQMDNIRAEYRLLGHIINIGRYDYPEDMRQKYFEKNPKFAKEITIYENKLQEDTRLRVLLLEEMKNELSLTKEILNIECELNSRETGRRQYYDITLWGKGTKYLSERIEFLKGYIRRVYG